MGFESDSGWSRAIAGSRLTKNSDFSERCVNFYDLREMCSDLLIWVRYPIVGLALSQLACVLRTLEI